MSMLTQAFHGYGKKTNADLHAYAVAYLRQKSKGKGFSPVALVLLTGQYITADNGRTYYCVSFPHRTLQTDLGERRAMDGTTYMFPRKAANHMMNEYAGFDANGISPPLPEVPPSHEADGENLSASDVSEKNLGLKQRRNDAKLIELYRKDVSILGHDGTATLNPGAETTFFNVNLGNNHITLPSVRRITTASELPEHVAEADLQRIMTLRKNTQWVEIADIMSGIEENYSGNPFAMAEGLGPQFTLNGIHFAANTKKNVPIVIDPNCLFGLVMLVRRQKFAKMIEACARNPRTKKHWASPDDVLDIVKQNNLTPTTPTNRWTTYAHNGSTNGCAAATACTKG